MQSGFFKKGSITIEAAILMPFLVVSLVIFAFIIKIYFVNEIVQHAIAGACDEMSVYSLLYYETKAEDLIGGISKFADKQLENSTSAKESWIKELVSHLSGSIEKHVRAQVALIPAAKLLVRKNLESSIYRGADERLKALNVIDGFNGVDFSESSMLEDGKSINIVVNYKISFPFFSESFSGIKIKQMASTCIWAGEEGVNAEEDTGEKCIWDMTNIKRGVEIRKLQGGNLPYNYPSIAKFQNGTATSIKSLNIDKAYYRNTMNLKKKISAYINKLDDFNGKVYGNIEIQNNEILKKELLIIMPETELLLEQQLVINECKQIAQAKGIALVIIKAYGKSSSGVNGGEDADIDETE